MEFLLNTDDRTYEISQLVTKVSYKDSLNDGCSKLEFNCINEDLPVNNGSAVSFKFNDNNIFFGYVFKHSRGRDKEINVTAYDQLRYCKAKDTILVKNETATTLVKRMCNTLGLKYGQIEDSGYLLATSSHYDKTWLDMVYSGISDTVLYLGKKYALRDEFGKITLRNLENLRLSLVLGDESLVYDYSYEQSIDDEFYNQIKLVSRNDASGKDDTYIAKDSNSIIRYGLLQYYEKLDNNANYAKTKDMADQLLGLYNHEVESLSLNCLGDTSVRAGTSVYGQIGDIKLGRYLLVKSVTHNFLPVHTMSLEVVL